MSIIPDWFSAPDRVPSVCALHSSHDQCFPEDRQDDSRLILMLSQDQPFTSVRQGRSSFEVLRQYQRDWQMTRK
jgi:hypothetical protein